MRNATRTIGFKDFKNALSFVLNDNSKSKSRLMVDGCADTSITAIRNGFREISRSDRTATLIRFNDNLS